MENELTNEVINNIFKLNVHFKNNAGWFQMTVKKGLDDSILNAIPSDNIGYHPVPNNTPNVHKPPFNIILPNDLVNELTPRFGVYRNGAGTPNRGFWNIKFDVSCIGRDLIERKVTPLYDITARNYFDELKLDEYGNDGFNIYLLKEFDLNDIANMLNENTNRYNTFKLNTGRP